jgi:hypothetical protein
MPITPFLNGESFDLETTRVMGVALEMTCLALRTGDCADDVKQAIANKIIALHWTLTLFAVLIFGRNEV